MNRNLLIQLLAGALSAAMLAGAAALVPFIQQQRYELQLGLEDPEVGQLPPMVTLTQTLGGPARAGAVLYLWHRANRLKDAGQYQEANQWAQWITSLQPAFPAVWAFHAWNNAYNISVATHTKEERWYWVNSGVELLRDRGIRYNPRSERLYKELGWIFIHKIGGNTDDMHWYYKRQLAVEWQELLGPPPHGMEAQRVLERFRKIVDAPRTLSDLYDQTPEARELVRRIRAAGYQLDVDALRAIGRLDVYRHSFAWYLREGDPNMLPAHLDYEIARIYAEYLAPEKQPIMEALLNFLRRDVLIRHYNMSPQRMWSLMHRDLSDPDDLYFGPLDWRHPASHSLYWTIRGVEASRYTRHRETTDVLNVHRQVIHSVQMLAHEGRIDLDPVLSDEVRIRLSPDPNFFEAYDRAVEAARADILASDDRPGRGSAYDAGHENFLLFATRTLYLAGRTAEAERFFNRAANLYGDRPHNQRSGRYDQPLGVAVQEMIIENMGSMAESAALIDAMLFRAYDEGLAESNFTAFNRLAGYARWAHEQFQEGKLPTAGAVQDRMRHEPFEVWVSLAFRSYVTEVHVPILRRAMAWRRAPVELAQANYDQVIDILRQQCEAAGLDPARAFPEPPGMTEVRERRRDRTTQ